MRGGCFVHGCTLFCTTGVVGCQPVVDAEACNWESILRFWESFSVSNSAYFEPITKYLDYCFHSLKHLSLVRSGCS